jgi:deazaflavin-dependent oxidoreductase (nitroreductase family)
MSESKPSLPIFWRISRSLRGLQVKVFQRFKHAGNVVLLLTTKGRKSGLDRVTPLQYEQVDGLIYIASARGQEADWFRNIQVDPKVKVQIRGIQQQALAEPVTDPQLIADFLEMRLQKNPLMIRLIMTLAGLPLKYGREDLVLYATGRAMVIINPNAKIEA